MKKIKKKESVTRDQEEDPTLLFFAVRSSNINQEGDVVYNAVLYIRKVMYCTTQYCIPVMWCTLVLYASSYIKCIASCFDVVCFVPAMLPIKVSDSKEALFLICHCFVCSAGVMLCITTS